MWVLIIIVFLSMTFADTCSGIYTVLLSAEDNKVLLRMGSWEYCKHDLAFNFDGLADVGGAFAAVGSGFSFLTVTAIASHIHIHVNFTIWTVLAIIAIMAGSWLGGKIGDRIALRVVGKKIRELRTP